MKKNAPISDGQIGQLLDFIFQDAKDLYKKLTPKGWENSEYVRFFHPSARQQFEEDRRVTKRLNSLIKKEKTEEYEGKETDFEQDDLEGVNGYGEFLYVLGLSVYDIFSMNHEVKASDGTVYDMGSFRGSGRFMAEYLNAYPDDRVLEEYGYLDFYMGSVWIESRADLLPFYTYIFHKLKEKGCLWEYYFPRLSLIDFKNNPRKIEGESPEDYNPEHSVARDLEASKKEREIQDFRNELDTIHDKTFEKAKYEPLAKTVQAFKNVYGILPDGHPKIHV